MCVQALARTPPHRTRDTGGLAVACPVAPAAGGGQARDVPGAGSGRAARPHKSETDLRREILVSATPKESWVALKEDQELVEVLFDRPDQDRILGDVFLGRVDAVLPGIQAAFVDLGTDKAGFLHVADLNYGDGDDDDDDEDGGSGNGNGNGNGNGKGKGKGGGRGGRGRKQRKLPPIQDHLQKGQTLLVQVTKEAIGTKGPRLTADVSLPGRFLVYMPYSSRVGVSRKIEGREQRAKLREMAQEVLPPNSGGIIVRTVSEEVNKKTIEQEFQSLHQRWLKIKAAAETASAPAPVHREAKLISGVIRDLFSDKFEALRVDSREVFEEVREYVRSVDPGLLNRVHLHQGPVSLFDEFGVEEEIQKAFQRTVRLKSGGYIIIEPTEALVSIDVNTGKFTGKGRKDPEETILRTNLEAARAISKQLRLRDIGGIIVVDFIDMETQENRYKVLRELRSYLGRDRARTKACEVSSLGLVEMTRQRIRPSLFNSLTDVCPSCGGIGRVYKPATVVRSIERSLARAAASKEEKSIVVRMHPEVALWVVETEPQLLRRLRGSTRLELNLRDDPLMRLDEFRLLSGPAETDVTEKYAA
ncbi:MAG: Rne/Rng family ribonuclease [Gemmatimonadetes bacterium]|nr:Rne/Rng family ribonuclease [Gemmatimonadota bacterium]